MLANLVQRNVIYSEVSLDDYHDPIDPKVITAFKNPNSLSTFRGAVRNTTQDRNPQPQGRALQLLEYDDNTDIERDGSTCMCEEHIVKPNGNVYQCGCDEAPYIGNVNKGNIDSPLFGQCCHSSEFIEECINNGYKHLLS